MQHAGDVRIGNGAPARHGPGVFVAVAGPSGAGKDSLIAGARSHFRSDPRVTFVTRVITRPADASEPHEPSTPLAFRLRAARDEFVLWWEANGLSYGLPAQLIEDIAAARIVVANVSRDVTPMVRATFANSLIVHVTASPETLMGRMASRGREGPDDRAARMSRALLKDHALEADVRIENDGPLADGVDRFVALLEALLAGRHAAVSAPTP
jgi:ribose 1,5-bisphosphokinase